MAGVPGAGQTPSVYTDSTARSASLLFDLCLQDPVPISDLFHWNTINDSMPGSSAAHDSMPGSSAASKDTQTRQSQNKLLKAIRKIAE